MVHYKNLISLVACRNLHRRFCTPRSRDEEEDILVLFFSFFLSSVSVSVSSPVME